MVKSPKTGRELGGEEMDRAPPWLRRVFDWFGISAHRGADRDGD